MKKLLSIFLFLFSVLHLSAQTRSWCDVLGSSRSELIKYFTTNQTRTTIDPDGTLTLGLSDGGKLQFLFDDKENCNVVSILAFGAGSNDVLLDAVSGCEITKNTESMIEWKCNDDCYASLLKRFQPVDGFLLMIAKK